MRKALCYSQRFFILPQIERIEIISLIVKFSGDLALKLLL